MIYGKNFNLLHIPKTGGTWLRTLFKSLPGDLRLEAHPLHLPYRDIPEERIGLPTYALIRNPFDWYVSLWGHRHRNITRRQHEFAAPIERLDDFHKKVYERFHKDFAHSLETLSAWEPWEEGLGQPLRWLSARFDYMIKPPPGAPPVTVFRYEDVPPRALAQRLLGVVPDHVTRMIENMPRQNVGEREKDYRLYYTPKLRELVEKHDRGLLRKYRYAF